MSSVHNGTSAALGKSASDEGFPRPTLINQSRNSTSTPEHLRELSRQHDIMLRSNLSQNSEGEHMATSQSAMAFTDWMELTD